MDLNNGIDYLLDDINDDLKEDLSEKAFEWFKKLPGEMGNHLSKAYAKMCRRLFSPEQVGELSEIFLDKRIKRKAESHLPFLQDLKDMVDLMYEIGKTDEEVDEYLAAYKETPEYKKALLKQAELKGDTEEAIRLLEDIEGIAGKRGGSRENSKRLIELYEQSGLTDKLINELKYHINRFPTFSTEMLPKLKPLLPPDEWGEYVQEALGDTKYSEGKAEIYAADGDYGKILEMVLKDNPSSEGLYRKYETILNREFPEEIGKWRVSKLDTAMRAANSRTLYQEVAFRLLGLKDMPGGPELISETIERWKNEYPKRRAMIEELDNIKPYLM